MDSPEPPAGVDDLTRHDRGRQQRVPGPALRQLVGTLDGERCRFPGCSRRRRLHAHHVRHWAHGGSTDLGNLLLLCSRHHTLVHRDGVELRLRADRSLVVRAGDGTLIEHHPALPWRPEGELDPDQVVSAETLPPRDVQARIDLRYAVAVLCQQAA